MDKSQKNLVELGLAPNEALVYLASLELGPATAQQLAGKAAVVRPTAYVAIGGLVKRGLMSQHKKGKKAYFQAEKPERLAHLLEIEKREIIEREAKLKEIMPMLASLVSHSGDKPDVKYYEGFEGLEAMREVLFQSGAKQLDGVTSQQYKKTVSQESIGQHGKKMDKSGIHNRVVYFTNQPDLPKYGKMKEAKGITEFKNIPTNNVKDFGEISIFGSQIALIVYLEKPYGFIINSIQIANTARAMFEAFWRTI